MSIIGQFTVGKNKVKISCVNKTNQIHHARKIKNNTICKIKTALSIGKSCLDSLVGCTAGSSDVLFVFDGSFYGKQ